MISVVDRTEKVLRGDKNSEAVCALQPSAICPTGFVASVNDIIPYGSECVKILFVRGQQPIEGIVALPQEISSLPHKISCRMKVKEMFVPAHKNRCKSNGHSWDTMNSI